MTLDAIRAASRAAQQRGRKEDEPQLAPAPLPCPYCGHLDDNHATRCKLWMLTPEARRELYGYPVCKCCGLPDGPDRDERHRREWEYRHRIPVGH